MISRVVVAAAAAAAAAPCGRGTPRYTTPIFFFTHLTSEQRVLGRRAIVVFRLSINNVMKGALDVMKGALGHRCVLSVKELTCTCLTVSGWCVVWSQGAERPAAGHPVTEYNETRGRGRATRCALPKSRAEERLAVPLHEGPPCAGR